MTVFENKIISQRPSELDSVTVEYKKEDGRVVKCFCGEQVTRSIVPHFKTKHEVMWREWVKTFVELRGLGFPLKKIMRLYRAGDGKLLFSWTVIERAIRREVEAGNLNYNPPPKKRVDQWEPKDFSLQTTTLWDFPRRGDWAVHSGDYRGNWPPQVPRNLIERYTQKGDLVVDAFVGGGTTLIEAWLLGRRSIGFDLSNLAIQSTKAKIREMKKLAKNDQRISLNPDYHPRILKGNSLKLGTLLRNRQVQEGEVRLVCAHPPYLDSLEYTSNNKEDLALIKEPGVFFEKMLEFAHEVSKVLAPKGICAILIGDVRKRGKIIPLGFNILENFLYEGFELDSIVVKTQHKDRSSEFYIDNDSNGLLMAHEYLFILRNT